MQTRMTLCVALCATTLSPCVRADDAFPPADPAAVGMSAESLDALAAIVAEYVEKDWAVGAELLVIKDRRTVLHAVYGVRDRDDELPWTDETICNMRSMTKTFTGAAIQILIDRGAVALDDPASKHLPAFDTNALRDVTIDQLLTHRAGLPLTAFTTGVDQYPDLAAVVAAVGERGPEFDPGSKFWYSDAGTDVLAAIVETVTGETVDAFVTREIFTPLGMDDTFYALDADDPRFGRIATLSFGSPNAWTSFWDPSKGPLYPFAWGSQTAYGTPEDYAKFLAMWMDGGAAGDGRVLSEAAVERTLTPVSPMSMLGSDRRFPTEFDGLEVWYGRMAVLHMPQDDPTGSAPVVIGHSGSDGTIAWAWPERDLMALYFTQSRGGSTPLRLEEHINRLLLRDGDAPVAEVVPAAYEPYLGVYIANFGSFTNERFEVRMRDGRLALDIPSQMVFDLLEPNDEGLWAFEVAPERVQVEFVRDEEGAVNLLRLHQGPAVFEAPREGTALAIEQSAPKVVDPAIIAAMCGAYTDEESGARVRIYTQGDDVCIRGPEGPELHLRPTDDSHRWTVREAPHVTISFQFDDAGAAVSITQEIGDNTKVLPRAEE
ncbi:MAG: serine hydrolase domain-containing protein [Phycisphaerales bacterium]